MGLAGSLDSTEINSVEISEECQKLPGDPKIEKEKDGVNG